jgi:hypothetical protein
MAFMMTPAEQLEGLELDGGWRVVEKQARKPTATGSFFSVGYVVEQDDGTRGFLKALDFTKAMSSPDPMAVFHAMSSAFVFEQKLCEKCSRLSRVARSLSSGLVQVGCST